VKLFRTVSPLLLLGLLVIAGLEDPGIEKKQNIILKRLGITVKIKNISIYLQRE